MENKIYAIVLAGGQSRRMGKDKKFLQLSGMKYDFLCQALTVLHELSTTIACYKKNTKKEKSQSFYLGISCCPEHKSSIEKHIARFAFAQDVHFFLDRGEGVTEAIVECLTQSACPCLFIPCDTPFLPASMIEELLQKRQATLQKRETTQKREATQKRQTTLEKREMTLEKRETTLQKTTLEKKEASFEKLAKLEKSSKREESEKLEALANSANLANPANLESFVVSLFSDEENNLQPLIGIYEQESLAYLKKAVQENTPLKEVFPAHKVQRVFYNQSQESFFVNLNSHKDIDLAKAHLSTLCKENHG